MDGVTKKFIEGQIEKLAIMVAKGFEHTDKEIGELRDEIVAIDLFPFNSR